MCHSLIGVDVQVSMHCTGTPDRKSGIKGDITTHETGVSFQNKLIVASLSRQNGKRLYSSASLAHTTKSPRRDSVDATKDVLPSNSTQAALFSIDQFVYQHPQVRKRRSLLGYTADD